MRVNDLRDTLASESLLPESSLDIVQHFSVGRIGFIQQVLELKVRVAKSVTEVLGEDPSTVYWGTGQELALCSPSDLQAYMASWTAWALLSGALGKKKGLSGKQYRREASFIT